jgi:Flp pilus assembly protein TadG
VRRRRQRGTSIIEFTLTGIPAIFLIISIFEMGRGMWNYHTLARAVNAGARLAALHGQTCTTGTNSCSITVGTIATAIETAALGLPAGSLNVTLTTNSGTATTCNPLTSCTSSTTVWPPSTDGDNSVGNNVTVSAQYTFNSALAMFWPGSTAVSFAACTFPATSTERILF